MSVPRRPQRRPAEDCSPLVHHDAGVPAKAHLVLSSNVINLLNQGTATNYFPHELYWGQAIAVDETEFYTRGVDTKALIAEQGVKVGF